MEGSIVKMIDQTLLPHKFKIIELKNLNEVADAIKTMKVRGAPAIGATGAYGLAQAALQAPEANFQESIQNAANVLGKTRPTAYDLFHGIDRIMGKIEKAGNVEEARQFAVKEAEKYAGESVEACKKIGEFGAGLIKDGFRILTHCNAGWLACVDWSTALSPIYIAKREGKNIFVYADETRPRLQGAMLTSWELLNEGIPHTVIADNAAGYFMKNGEIDMVIVGADRTTSNGDVANKIGTYEKAVCAKENGIPFYVAAPTSTIDFNLKSGEDIPIEERNEEEVLFVWGMNDKGEIERIRITPEGTKARNPAFDVTPGKYITGIITEKGIFKPNELMKIKPNPTNI
jgi:translation initiation factor eIF-2B subunit alpha/methylthioribose-1-phosphate isomerase